MGYFRSQLGFTHPDQPCTYSTPKNVQRFISSSLSDPKSSHQPPQGHGSQQLSWQSFEEPRPVPQRAWSMQAPPHPHPTTPHTMMVVEGDLAGNHPEVNITMVSYHCGYMLCLLTNSQVDPSSITCCVLHNDGEARTQHSLPQCHFQLVVEGRTSPVASFLRVDYEVPTVDTYVCID